MLLRLALALVLSLLALPALAQPNESFESFIRSFEAKAVAAGVSRETYRRATASITPDPNVPELVTTQPEFTTPMWEYIDSRVSSGRISRGQDAIAAHATLFEEAGQRYGVDPY